jgi:hypothetical protein
MNVHFRAAARAAPRPLEQGTREAHVLPISGNGNIRPSPATLPWPYGYRTLPPVVAMT